MRSRWVKIPLVVAVAFAFTMSVEILGERSAHAGGERGLLCVVLTSPAFMLTDVLEREINPYLWLPIESTIDPQLIWKWVTIAFNTIFYSGLFWLFSMFVTEARQSEGISTKATPKAIAVRVLLSAAVALLLGMAAMFLYFDGSCWDGRTDCAGYSRAKVSIAFLLAPFIFLLGRDPAWVMLGWPVLWAYYFGLLSIARWGIKDFLGTN